MNRVIPWSDKNVKKIARNVNAPESSEEQLLIFLKREKNSAQNLGRNARATEANNIPSQRLLERSAFGTNNLSKKWIVAAFVNSILTQSRLRLKKTIEQQESVFSRRPRRSSKKVKEPAHAMERATCLS